MGRGEVVNTVSCQKENGICFFSVWNFYDDSGIWPAAHALGMEDCLHYCVMESMDGSINNCKFGGVVTDENGERICSKKGQGAVHGQMNLANTSGCPLSVQATPVCTCWITRLVS